MGTVRVSSKGQIVIPKDLRQAHGIRTGAEFEISAVGRELRLTPAPLFAATKLEDAAGCLYRKGRKPMSESETKAAILRIAKARDAAARSR